MFSSCLFKNNDDSDIQCLSINFRQSLSQYGMNTNSIALRWTDTSPFLAVLPNAVLADFQDKPAELCSSILKSVAKSAVSNIQQLVPISQRTSTQRHMTDSRSVLYTPKYSKASAPSWAVAGIFNDIMYGSFSSWNRALKGYLCPHELFHSKSPQWDGIYIYLRVSGAAIFSPITPNASAISCSARSLRRGARWLMASRFPACGRAHMQINILFSHSCV